MSYYFNSEHELFRAGLKDFLQKEVIPHVEDWEKAQQVPKALWKKFADMGYIGFNYPEEYGGINADFFYSVVFLEEISKCFSGGFAIIQSVHQYMSNTYILKHGSAFLKQKYLPKALSGETLACIGITEPEAGSDVANIQTKAIKQGDFYIVNGAKTFITNAYYGDYLVTVVKTQPEKGLGGISLLVIDLNSEGVSARKLTKLGWHASDTAELNFDEVRVPVENLIGEEGQGFYYLMGGLQLERLVGAIGAVAGSEHTLQYAMQYLAERKAFGKNLNKFQVLRHKVAQLASEIEVQKQFVYYCCRLHADGKYAVKECSMAKLLATELMNKVATECLQFFGGYGYMEEYKIARIFRDSRILTIGGGTSEIMREIIAKMVIDDVQYQVNENLETKSKAKLTASDIIRQLPQRFKQDKALGKKMIVHFFLQGEGGGNFTVEIVNGECKVAEGLQGTADCTVETEADIYCQVETGSMNAQEAMMTQKLRVSNLAEMFGFSLLFRKFSQT